MELPHSEACVRNSQPIYQILKDHLHKGDLLEMGFGTAQHAEFFVPKFPNIQWYACDQTEYAPIFNLRFKENCPDNLHGPIELKVQAQTTIYKQLKQQRFDYFFTANTFHIMNQQEVDIWCDEIHDVMNQGAKLFIYGPFKYDGKFTSDSNESFDLSLRSRGCGSCIKDFERIQSRLKAKNISFKELFKLPANNELLIFHNS